MLFNSLAYAVFLPIVFICYWLLPHKFRWVLLLVASYYFYMSWNAKYVVLLLITSLISYIAARLLEHEESQRKRRCILAVSALVCFGILFFFKYFNFFTDTAAAVLNIFSISVNPITLQILLPVGISFYTFQTLSYVMDVYHGKVKPEHHFGIYAAFISFFPQLVAGPIERTDNLLPQIKKEVHFDYHQATYGLKLMAWGFFKKLAIADVLAPYVDVVYASPKDYFGFDLAAATFFFAIQIYCDFSGYGDIAIGTAKLFGINLMKNFDSPYFSSSIKEFWARWHISLSTWFRDYVYIPLGGNRCSKTRHIVNLLLTFLVSGLWHGASWTFVIWGGIHGVMQLMENSLERPLKKIRKHKIGSMFLIILVFGFCNMAWIFFRAVSFGDAIHIIVHMFDSIANLGIYLSSNVAIGKRVVLSTCFVSFALALFDFLSLKRDVIAWISEQKALLRWFFYLALVWLILARMPLSGQSEFIYFQF